MFRKGQNYRIFINGGVVAEETSCSVTRGVDTEDGNNKDIAADSTTGDIGGANPIAMYKNMSFQVDAQGEGAKALFQTALGLMTADGGAVGWAETNGAQNRVGTPTYVKAICNDLTITAPNRQPITCSAQFTVIPGTPTIPSSSSSSSSSVAASSTYTVLRGEFLRLFVGTSTTAPVALATNVSLHVSLSMEDATTKDDTSASASTLDYRSQVPTQVNFDISSDCLYEGDNGDGGLGSLTEGTIYDFDLADASGQGQQTKGTSIAWGKAMLTSLTANAPVNQSITYNASLTGVGVLNPTDDDDND
jgi:hypothetical protein